MLPSFKKRIFEKSILTEVSASESIVGVVVPDGGFELGREAEREPQREVFLVWRALRTAGICRRRCLTSSAGPWCCSYSPTRMR